MIRSICGFLALLIAAVTPVAAQTLQAVVKNGKHDLSNAPVRVPLQWPKDAAASTVTVHAGEKTLVGQLTYPSFATESIKAEEGKVRKDLIIIVPELKAGATLNVTIKGQGDKEAAASSLRWTEKPGEWAEVVAKEGGKDRPMMRYMYKAYDTSSPEKRNETYKVFHHLYDPAGTRFVTNGGHTDEGIQGKKLAFPHHRGLMLGFNRCSYIDASGAKKQADTWHCTGDAHVSHQETLFKVDGPILAEHRVLLTWHGPKNEVFAKEERQMSVYRVPGGTLVEFASRLKPTVGKVHLDGDPQHAGFQFRASNDVAAKTAKETYYLRPEGKGKPGETRNWDAKGKAAATINVPWKVMSFVLDGKRYSAAYLDHPGNPGEKRYSERDYGRMGCYFEYDMTPEHPLVLNHRIWLQDGEMTPEQVESLRNAFIDPPHVERN